MYKVVNIFLSLNFILCLSLLPVCMYVHQISCLVSMEVRRGHRISWDRKQHVHAGNQTYVLCKSNNAEPSHRIPLIAQWVTVQSQGKKKPSRVVCSLLEESVASTLYHLSFETLSFIPLCFFHVEFLYSSLLRMECHCYIFEATLSRSK